MILAAYETCLAFEEYDVFWVEEPFRVERKEDFSRLRENVRLNITASEELCHISEFNDYIQERCVDILQPDLSRCGGITVAKKVRDLAAAAGIRIIPHNFKSGLLMSATLQNLRACFTHSFILSRVYYHKQDKLSFLFLAGAKNFNGFTEKGS